MILKFVFAVSLLSIVGCTSGSSGPRTATAATAPAETSEFPLDEERTFPGTGISVRAPRGSEATPFGGAIIHRERRLQLFAVANEGDETLHAQAYAALTAGATEINREEIELTPGADGQARRATLIVDQQPQSEEMLLERVWLYVQEGRRSYAVVGGYESTRSERLRALMRASLRTVRWNDAAPIDAEATLGYRLGNRNGLELDRSSSAKVTYRDPAGQSESTTPKLYLMHLPAQVPEDEFARICSGVLLQVGPITEENAQNQRAISGVGFQGCEVQGPVDEATPESSILAAAPHNVAMRMYAALLHFEGKLFLVAGIAPASESAWMARFAESATTIENSTRLVERQRVRPSSESAE